MAEAGQVELVIAFSGKITDNMTGIYPSYYTVDGVKKEVLSTQFESHFAREAFPCVDEPEAKATFDLALRFDQAEGEVALSNMPEIDVETARKQVSGSLRQHLVCLPTCWPLLLVTCKVLPLKQKWYPRRCLLNQSPPTI